MDEQQRRRPLAAEQEVQRVVVSHGSHVQQFATGRRERRSGVQLYHQLTERRRISDQRQTIDQIKTV